VLIDVGMVLESSKLHFQRNNVLAAREKSPSTVEHVGTDLDKSELHFHVFLHNYRFMLMFTGRFVFRNKSKVGFRLFCQVATHLWPET